VELTRRQFALGVAAALAACRKSSAEPAHSTSAGPTSTGWEWRSARFAGSSDQPNGQAAEILSPSAQCALPTIVALHGRGEADHGLDDGAHGWERYYALGIINGRLFAPPLTPEDVGGFLDNDRIAAINASLAKNPYAGLCVACPYTPNLGHPSVEEAQPFARFVTRELLTKSCDLTGAPRTREKTGIDGVSMGGRLALLVGLSHPEVFGSIGALQPQIDVWEAPMFAELAKKAMEKQKFTLRLVSSTDDAFLDAVQALDAELTKVGVPHRTIITKGPHDYVWNKGPGGCEMLMFHERVLRGLDPV
jgi:hypothetical protein